MISMSTSAATLPETFYWQGGTTLKVSKQIHVENRARVLSLAGFEDNSFIFLAGGVQLSRADTDHELLFR
jgi:hypothetical protein